MALFYTVQFSKKEIIFVGSRSRCRSQPKSYQLFIVLLLTRGVWKLRERSGGYRAGWGLYGEKDLWKGATGKDHISSMIFSHVCHTVRGRRQLQMWDTHDTTTRQRLHVDKDADAEQCSRLKKTRRRSNTQRDSIYIHFNSSGKQKVSAPC